MKNMVILQAYNISSDIDEYVHISTYPQRK